MNIPSGNDNLKDTPANDNKSLSGSSHLMPSQTTSPSMITTGLKSARKRKLSRSESLPYSARNESLQRIAQKRSKSVQSEDNGRKLTTRIISPAQSTPPTIRVESPALSESSETQGEEDGTLIPDMYFRDGERWIDFILAVQEHDDPVTEKKRKYKRKTFEHGLSVKQGLELEYECKKSSRSGKTSFVKVHAPWDVLIRQAELLKLRMPLRDLYIDDHGCASVPFKRGSIYQFLIPDDKLTFFTNAQRSWLVYDILKRTKWSNIASTVMPIGNPDGDYNGGRFGIERLLNNGSYCAAFPLHEGDYHKDEQTDQSNERHELYQNWVKIKIDTLLGRQPFDMIRKYFGCNIALYCKWLDHYTVCLIAPAALGFIMVLIGLITSFIDPSIHEICYNTSSTFIGNAVMCPICDYVCDYWLLRESCPYHSFKYMFDHYLTCGSTIFMCVWAKTSCILMRRKYAKMKSRWQFGDSDDEGDQIPRPEFELRAKCWNINTITGNWEPYVSPSQRIPKYFLSFAVMLLMICLLIATAFCVIVIRTAVLAALVVSEYNTVVQMSAITRTLIGSCISVTVVIILSEVYRLVAIKLTDNELHRTQKDWDNSFRFKIFMFTAMNNYNSMVYFAFFRGSFIGRPGAFVRLLGGRQDECHTAGCIFDLSVELAILMSGKQLYSLVREAGIPFLQKNLKCYIKSFIELQNLDNQYTRWERDFDLLELPAHGLLYDYLKMVIQFGFVFLFIAAFPLAPFFAIINNLVEIRMGAYKYVCNVKRPVAEITNDIDFWQPTIEALARVAALSNGLIIAFTSDFIERIAYMVTFNKDGFSMSGYANWTLSVFNTSHFETGTLSFVARNSTNITTCRYISFRDGQDMNYELSSVWWYLLAAKFGFVVCFQNLVIVLTWLVSRAISDVPKDIKEKLMRAKYVVKKKAFQSEEDAMKATRRASHRASLMPFGFSGDLRRRRMTSPGSCVTSYTITDAQTGKESLHPGISSDYSSTSVPSQSLNVSSNTDLQTTDC